MFPKFGQLVSNTVDICIPDWSGVQIMRKCPNFAIKLSDLLKIGPVIAVK
jgi:hypothetical protein